MINDISIAGASILAFGIGFVALYLVVPELTSVITISLILMGLGFGLMVTGAIFGWVIEAFGGNI